MMSGTVASYLNQRPRLQRQCSAADASNGDVAESSMPGKATGNHVLPHKFRKSRRDPERLRSISKDKEPLCEISCFKRCRRKQDEVDDELKDEEQLYVDVDPFRKRCLRTLFNSVYVILVVIAAVVTYSMVSDLIKSMNNPVHSVHFDKVVEYDAPGIAVYPGGAKFKACGHYYNNVVTSKVRLKQLDLVNRNCTFSEVSYSDPHYPNLTRDALVVRGPTSFTKREAIFLHFELEDNTRDFFTVSYFVFPEWDSFNISLDRGAELINYHRYVPTFALSAGLRMWIKLIMSEKDMRDGSKYSVVRFYDRRPPEVANTTHLFFIFFEWKNDIIERSYLIYTTTPWSIGAGLCGVFLTLHRGFQIAQTSYRRVQKDKQRRSIRKRTLRELRQLSQSQNSEPASPSPASKNSASPLVSSLKGRSRLDGSRFRPPMNRAVSYQDETVTVEA